MRIRIYLMVHLSEEAPILRVLTVVYDYHSNKRKLRKYEAL